MVHKITSYDHIDPRKLMDLYQEGNEENIDYFYPGATDRALALKKCEEDFLKYIRTEFFPADGSEYWVLEEGDVWVSALRLYKIEVGFYYIEALETHPEFRKKGYAAHLLQEVIDDLKKRGSFKLCDCVGKTNEASLRTHMKCGFQIADGPAVDYLCNKVNHRCYGIQYSHYPKQTP